jgi:hypothetical protein
MYPGGFVAPFWRREPIHFGRKFSSGGAIATNAEIAIGFVSAHF